MRLAAAALFAPLLCAAPVAAEGPLELRDEWLLAQGRLSMPATAPDPLPAGRTLLRLDFDWGSDFGWEQSNPGERPRVRYFLVDGEHRTLALTLRRGVGHGVDAALRVPLEWRGPGLMDGVIDWWHRFSGLPDNGRPLFLTGQLRVLGPAPWTGRAGSGLGRLEVESRVRLLEGGTRFALVGRVALPTATGAFDSRGADLGVQAVAGWGRGRFGLYLGAGGTRFGSTTNDGIGSVRHRAHGFLALEWRLNPGFSLHAQADAEGRLATGIDRYPALQSYLRLAASVGSGRWRVSGGFTEGIADQQSTTDFGVFLAIERRFF